MAAGISRSSKYVEENYKVYVIVVVGHYFHSEKFDGLKCNLCVSLRQKIRWAVSRSQRRM